jgi:hypothetical protein
MMIILLQFIDTLFPAPLVAYIKPKQTTLFFLSCGALVSDQENFKGLLQSVQNLSFNDMVSFTAPELHATLTVSFFVDFTQRVLVEGFPLCTSFKAILTATSQSFLARHTNVVYIRHSDDGSKLCIERYTFTHPKWCPWGHQLPLACPGCSSPCPWTDPQTTGSTIPFTCRFDSCTTKCHFQRPDNLRFVGGDMSGGRWMIDEQEF